ncbi:MAG: tyrosine-type recombinase/integrase [Akkermansia sp.]
MLPSLSKRHINVLQFVLHIIMASLFKRDNSAYWYAVWRNNDKRNLVSTRVPIRGGVINCIKETPSQARSRAQIVADGYEAADKVGVHAIKVKATIATLANDESKVVPSVKRFLNDYIASREGQLSNGTLVNSKTAIKLFLEHLGRKASMPISSVKRSDVKDFVNEQVKYVRKKTVQKYMTSLSPAFMSALDSEIIDKNPFFRIKVPDSQEFEDTEKEAFTIEEVTLMLQEFPSEWRSMVIFSLYTGGQRLGDMATLTWEQVDVEKGMIILRTTKTKRLMRIPIVAMLAEHIRTLSRDGVYVHPVAARRYERNGSANLSEQFRKELEYSGIVPKLRSASGSRARTVSPKSFHCLRATAATLLHTSGVDAALACEVVGHDSKRAHQLYIRPDDEQRRAALEKLADAMSPPFSDE